MRNVDCKPDAIYEDYCQAKINSINGNDIQCREPIPLKPSGNIAFIIQWLYKANGILIVK
jgi:hypothetical protein